MPGELEARPKDRGVGPDERVALAVDDPERLRGLLGILVVADRGASSQRDSSELARPGNDVNPDQGLAGRPIRGDIWAIATRPGIDPALCGPSRMRRCSSIHAIERAIDGSPSKKYRDAIEANDKAGDADKLVVRPLRQVE